MHGDHAFWVFACLQSRSFSSLTCFLVKKWPSIHRIKAQFGFDRIRLAIDKSCPYHSMHGSFSSYPSYDESDEWTQTVTPVWLLLYVVLSAGTPLSIGWRKERTHFFFSVHLHSVVRAMMATMTMAWGHYELYISSNHYIRDVFQVFLSPRTSYTFYSKIISTKLRL